MSAILYAVTLLDSLTPLITAGIDVYGLIKHGTEALNKMEEEGRDPTDEEWQTLNEITDKLHKELQDAS